MSVHDDKFDKCFSIDGETLREKCPNTEKYGVSLLIQSKFGKVQTRRKSEFGLF